MMNSRIPLAFPLVVCTALLAGAADAITPIPRRIPPPGIEIPADESERLERQLAATKKRLAAVTDRKLLADIEIYVKAVDFALRHGEFYSKNEIPRAYDALKMANQRLDQLAAGKTPWTTQRGLVVRGYRSPIDDSAQPYGLEIPERLDLTNPVPLYVWLHGRGDKTTDLHFIHQRQTRPGRISPPGAIVVHPFGRHCMGFKSAGEIDVLDVVQHVSSQYKIDADRVVLMGFSMGGAGAWHLGAHYADRWVTMSPGAGFAETARYNNLKKEDYPTWYEQTLWGLYDVPVYTRNLFNLPVVAYSGENDKQIQAARVMEEAFIDQGRKLTHIIGPGMGHQYHPDSLAEIMKRMEAEVKKGLNRTPKRVSLQTRTLRYHKVHWVEVLRMGEHWKDARVDAEIKSKARVVVTTKNVAYLRVSPFREMGGVTVEIDGHEEKVSKSHKPGTPPIFIRGNTDERPWLYCSLNDINGGAKKKHGLQGPIDDAFLSPFLVVRPTGKSKHEKVQKWIEFELAHFEHRWQALYRGRLRIKNDTEVTEEDIQKYHLILWGDPTSNTIIRRVFELNEKNKFGGEFRFLPLKWNERVVQMTGVRTFPENWPEGDQMFKKVSREAYSAVHHVPILIFPNPLQLPTVKKAIANAKAQIPNEYNYVVINSGPTHREGHDRTNSLQNPKLPDWAVIDITQSPDAFAPGRVVDADFFDEKWELRPSRE